MTEPTFLDLFNIPVNFKDLQPIQRGFEIPVPHIKEFPKLEELFHPNNLNSYEVIRRIPPAEREELYQQLLEVNEEDLQRLLKERNDPQTLLSPTTLIHEPKFPYAALKALIMGEIGKLEFCTLMALWTYVQEQPKDKPIFGAYVPLFKDGELNSAVKLKDTLQNGILPRLFNKDSSINQKQLYQDFIEASRRLQPHEQGYWVLSNPAKNNVLDPSLMESIRFDLGVRALMYYGPLTERILAPFSLHQVLIDVGFYESVTLNPVIGISSVADIREGSLRRHRDVLVPYVNKLKAPKIVDHMKIDSDIDASLHDIYHALRASRVRKDETFFYIALADNLAKVQQQLNTAIKGLEKKQMTIAHIQDRFSQLAPRLNQLSQVEQNRVYRQIFADWQTQKKVLSALKTIRMQFGQMKFVLYDMERNLAGTEKDTSYNNESNDLFITRIIQNILSALRAIDILQRDHNRQLGAITPRLWGIHFKNMFKEIPHEPIQEVKKTLGYNGPSQYTLGFFRGLEQPSSNSLEPSEDLDQHSVEKRTPK